MTPLSQLIGRKAVAVPGAFNAATALLVERAGFKAVYISGAGLSNSNGVADAGILSREEVLRLSSAIIKSVRIPAIVDIDTGFGGPLEVMETVSLFEAAGAAAVQIEDQEFPKRCGHLPGKAVIPPDEFIAKIKAARAARTSQDFLIIARTDARATGGIDEAIKRGKQYVEAGADMIFPEALETKEEFREYSRQVKAPLVANMTEFGKTPFITLDEFTELGYSFVLFPMTAFRAAMKAIEEALAELRTAGTQKGLMGRMMTREEIYRLIRYDIG
jgi:methylisocitrate lyase